MEPIFVNIDLPFIGKLKNVCLENLFEPMIHHIR